MIIKDYTLSLTTQGYCHVIDVTDEVQGKVNESAVQSGTVTVFVVGSTAGVTVVEYEPGLVKDLEELFDKLAPPTRDSRTGMARRQWVFTCSSLTVEALSRGTRG